MILQHQAPVLRRMKNPEAAAFSQQGKVTCPRMQRSCQPLTVTSASVAAEGHSSQGSGQRQPRSWACRRSLLTLLRKWGEHPGECTVCGLPRERLYLTWQWSRVVTPYRKTNSPMKAAGKSMPVYQPSQAKYSPIFSPKYRLLETTVAREEVNTETRPLGTCPAVASVMLRRSTRRPHRDQI